MTRWRLTFEVEIPEYIARTRLISVMAEEAELMGCEVQGFVERERVYPPLRALESYGGTDGD